MPGTYSVRVTLPEGYVYTVGGADSLARRTDEATVTIDLGELHMGETLVGRERRRAEAGVRRRRGLVRRGRRRPQADRRQRRAGRDGATALTDGADAGKTLERNDGRDRAATALTA